MQSKGLSLPGVNWPLLTNLLIVWNPESIYHKVLPIKLVLSPLLSSCKPVHIHLSSTMQQLFYYYVNTQVASLLASAPVIKQEPADIHGDGNMLF